MFYEHLEWLFNNILFTYVYTFLVFHEFYSTIKVVPCIGRMQITHGSTLTCPLCAYSSSPSLHFCKITSFRDFFGFVALFELCSFRFITSLTIHAFLHLVGCFGSAFISHVSPKNIQFVLRLEHETWLVRRVILGGLMLWRGAVSFAACRCDLNVYEDTVFMHNYYQVVSNMNTIFIRVLTESPR